MTDIDKIKREICAMQPVPSMVERLIQAVEAAHTAKLLAGVEMPEPVGRTMRFIGNDDYARKHSYCARTYDELPRGVYSDTWQDLEQLYTQDQLQQYAAAAAAQARMKALEEVTDLLREYDMTGSSFSMDVADLRWKP